MGSIDISRTSNAAKFDWQAAVKTKRHELMSRVPKDWLLSDNFIQSLNSTRLIDLDIPARSNILSPKEVEITEQYSAHDLLGKLRDRSFTSLEVTTAFCKRACIAQQLISCLTEVFYAEALVRARQLDDLYARTGVPQGPLHGLPISIKDSFNVKGQQSTVGYAKYLANPVSETDSPLVEMLLEAGAVLYVKTNIPQTMMTGDSENNIFGRTLNPQNTLLTAGGSSGGEGALVAFRGSILGVGTDIAGSIRIPALCCGTYGFKPTADRIPFARQVSGAMEGLPGLVPAAGPIANNLEDVELFLSTILSASPEDYDSTAIAAPWRKFQASARLRIGVLPEEAVFPLQPPVRRAMRNAVSALSKAGHEVVQLPVDADCSVSYANRLAFAYYILGPDPSSEHFGPDGEPMVTSVAARYNPMFSGPMPVDPSLEPFTRIDELHNARHGYKEAWRRYWVEQKMDVLICPPAQNTAVPHDTYGWPPYTQIWNVLDYPACVIPYGKASKELDPVDVEGVEYGPQPTYEAEKVDGAPCSIQVVTRRFKDEECLAAAKIIDAVLNGTK